MPQMGPMVGYAVTVVIQPSDKSHKAKNTNAWSEYREYLMSVPGPKIVRQQHLISCLPRTSLSLSHTHTHTPHTRISIPYDLCIARSASL